jgi:phosphoglycerate dehydrogenase-like enzyme
MKNALIDMDVHGPSLEKLKAIKGLSVEVIPAVEDSRLVDPKILKDKNYLFCSFPPKNLQDMNAIELIQVASAGYTQLFDLGLEKSKIACCNAAGVNDVPIAQWNVAMMINLARDVRGMIRNQEAGVWERPARFQMDLTGKTVGIWGYGGIGRETARLCKTMQMKVHVLDLKVGPRPTMYVVDNTGDPEGVLPDKVFAPEQKKEFLSGLDFLILSMPLTKRTRGIIGYDELTMLPDRAFVLNPARGPLIQEEGLLKVLREARIAGAALDTHYHYPMPADHPLWRFPNVIMTPHISGSTQSPFFLERVWDVFIKNVQRCMNSEAMLNQLSAAQLAGE